MSAQTINPKLAVAMAELNEAWTAILDKHWDGGLEHFGNFRLKVYTDDGYTATFYEEGIVFYPQEES